MAQDGSFSSCRHGFDSRRGYQNIKDAWMKTVSKNKYQALHWQFLDIIKKEIKKGRYKPSELIPSERKLEEQ